MLDSERRWKLINYYSFLFGGQKKIIMTLYYGLQQFYQLVPVAELCMERAINFYLDLSLDMANSQLKYSKSTFEPVIYL